jgi:hypothetical protein
MIGLESLHHIRLYRRNHFGLSLQTHTVRLLCLPRKPPVRLASSLLERPGFRRYEHQRLLISLDIASRWAILFR